MWSVIVTFAAAVLIIYFSYLFSRYVGKTMNKSSSSNYMRLIDQITVGQDRNIAIMQAGDKYLLVGITAGQINLLREMSEEELIQISPDETQTRTPDFKEMMEKLGNFKKKER